MKMLCRGLVLAVLVPLLAGLPSARADFLIANPSPASSVRQEPACQDAPGPVVFDRSRTAQEQPAEEDEGASSQDWRETMVTSYSLFLLTLFAGHAPPPAPQNPGGVVSSTTGGNSGGGGTTTQTSPEPATMLLGLLGSCALALVHMRRRRLRQEMVAN